MSMRVYTNPLYHHKKGISKGRYSLDEIHKLVIENRHREHNFRVDLEGDLVNVTSTRLRTFALKGAACIRCGVTGDHYIKEMSTPREPLFHLNLYHTHPDGNFVLMTKDHIIPKSKGGEDSLKNMQTMCAPCNKKKGNVIETIATLSVREMNRKVRYGGWMILKGYWVHSRTVKPFIVKGVSCRVCGVEGEVYRAHPIAHPDLSKPRMEWVLYAPDNEAGGELTLRMRVDYLTPESKRNQNNADDIVILCERCIFRRDNNIEALTAIRAH